MAKFLAARGEILLGLDLAVLVLVVAAEALLLAGLGAGLGRLRAARCAPKQRCRWPPARGGAPASRARSARDCQIRKAPVMSRKQAAAPAKKRSIANLLQRGDSARPHPPERRRSCQLRGKSAGQPMAQQSASTRRACLRVRSGPPRRSRRASAASTVSGRQPARILPRERVPARPSKQSRRRASLQCRAPSTSDHSRADGSHLRAVRAQQPRAEPEQRLPAQASASASALPWDRFEQRQPSILRARASSLPRDPRAAAVRPTTACNRGSAGALPFVELFQPLAPPREPDRAERRLRASSTRRPPSHRRCRTRHRTRAATRPASERGRRSRSRSSAIGDGLHRLDHLAALISASFSRLAA